MPLPTRTDLAWPPAPFDVAFKQIDVHDAWYVGDPSALHKAYQSGQTVHSTRPSQRAGGVVGTVARFFWGRPTPAHQQRTRLHVPIAADIATTSADLLFAEPPRVLLPKSKDGKVDHPAQERLEELMNDPATHSAWLESAEFASAHGGAYLRVVWDVDTENHPFLVGVAADSAIPEFRYGRLKAVTFWTVVKDEGSRVVRHLERHEAGFIYHGVYEGTRDALGRAAALADYDATRPYALLVNADGAIATGATGLTAAYIPNMLPQRRWRKSPGLTALGRSDFDGVEGIFDAIDEAYSSWMRDVRLAKARLIVDQSLMESNGVGQGASFDDDQELFTAVGGGAGKIADGSALTPHQFDIRWAEHQRTIQDLIRSALRSAGYSPASFGDDSVSVQETATQVKSKQQLSERTRDKKIRYWKTALGPLARTLLEVDAFVFKKNVGYDGVLPDVRFPEKAQQDPQELAQTIQLLDQANAISTELKVRMAHPDWDAVKIDEEVARIRAEQQTVDPFTFRPGIDDPEDDVEDEATKKEQADAFGTLVRSGVTQESAARITGLKGVQFTGERPVTTRPVNGGE